MVPHSLSGILRAISFFSLRPSAIQARPQRALRLVLPAILAGFGLAILLMALTGPQYVVHALAARPLPLRENLYLAPPPAPQAAPLRDPAPSVITVCLSTCPYTNVQAAVRAVAPDGLVKVAQGVYTGSGSQVVQITQSLTLRGGYTITNWNVANPISYPTILDGESARRVIYIDGVAAWVEGFHIRNGYISGYGGGVYIVGSSTPTVTGNTIYSNTATGGSASSGGGGVYVANGSALVQGNYICTNTTA